MNRKEWLDEIESTFQDEKFTAAQIRYFRPDRFIKMAGRIEEFKSDCKICETYFDEAVEAISRLKSEKGISEEAFYAYNSLFKKLTEHLRVKHKLVFPRYYSSIFTLIGILSGLVIWLVIWQFLGTKIDPIIDNKTMFLILGFAGLSIGRLVGNRKDKKIQDLNLRIY